MMITGKKLSGVGQLKHHSLIKTFEKPKTKVGKTVSPTVRPQSDWLKILILSKFLSPYKP